MSNNSELQADISKKLSKSALVLLIVYEIIALTTIILGFALFSDNYSFSSGSSYEHTYFCSWFGILLVYKVETNVSVSLPRNEVYVGNIFLIIFIMLLLLVVVPLCYFLISNRKRKLTQLTVSDSEVVGSYTAFIPIAKITLRMPMDKIDNVSATNNMLFFFTGKAIKIKSTSSSIKIPYVTNADEIVEKISEAIKAAGKETNQQTAEGNAQGNGDYTESLKRLAELREAGVITEEEFNLKKSELLKKI